MGKKTFFEIIVGIAAIVGCIAAVLVVPELRRLVGLEKASPETSTPAFATDAEVSITESPNWVFTLNYSFPSEFWSEGKHTYTLVTACANEQPGSATHEFNVSEDYPLISDYVYLRWGGGLRVGNIWGDLIEGINPSQSIIAVALWDEITKTEAIRLASDCTGAISWDGGADEPLTAQIFQR